MMENRLVEANIKKAKEVLKEADAVLITAGAGMGVDSGLPDFRGKEGFWGAYPIAKKLGLRFEELANPVWFETNPELAWAFYGHRLNLYRETNPHEGFYILKSFAENLKGKYFVFTSNVDGQFQKAEYDENKIVEIHGSIHYLQCSLPCSDEIWSAENIKVNIDEEKFKALPPLPRCKHCGKIARPNILMFGDYGWIPHRTEKQEFLFEKWLERLLIMDYRLVIIEIGAGKAVPTVRWTSERISNKFNAPLVRINPRDYDVPVKNGISIPLGGLEGIKRIIS
jgi:NAD-dependent SIR2 family protein deacetylase